MNLNIVDYDGRTALHLAASEGQTVILRFLLQIAKVDQTIRDRWGRTALDDARTFHRTACMALLLKAAQRKQQKTQQSKNTTKGLIGLVANNNNNGSGHLPITTNTSTTIESSGGEEEGELEEDEDEELLRSEEGGSMWDDDQPLSTNNKHHKGGGIVSGRSSKAAATAKWMIEHCVDRLSLGGNDEAMENGEKSRRLENKNGGGHQHKQAAIIASSKFHTSTGD